MDYREIFEQTRKTLAQKGYEIRDKDISEYVGSVLDEYEFTLKKCRGWRFGMWVYESNNQGEIKYKLSFFGISNDAIDKFKPSYAEPMFKFEWGINIDDEFPWWVNSMIGIFDMIRYHPIISYNIDMCYSQLKYSDPHIIRYFKIKARGWKHKIRDWYEYRSKYNPTYIWLNIVKRRLNKLGLYDKIEIVDLCGDMSWTSPRYEIRIFYKPEVNTDENDIKQWIYSWYKLNGNRAKYYYCIDPYKNGKLLGWWYDEPEEQDLIEAFGWRYKVCKYFRKRRNENIEKD